MDCLFQRGVQKIDLAVSQGLPSFVQQPALMGEDAVNAILDLKDGKTIKSEVKVPLKLVKQ